MNFWNRVTYVTHSCTVSVMCVCMCGVSVAYMCICMHHFPGPPNDISRRRKREYYRIHWVNSSSVYIYYKEFHFALLFFLFLHHKRISLFLYMSPWLYLQDHCASLHDSRCLTYKYSSRKDWFVTVRVKFFLVSFWDNDNALLVTELPIYLSILSLSLPLSLPLFHDVFWNVMHLMYVFIVCLFLLIFLYLRFLNHLVYVRNYALN